MEGTGLSVVTGAFGYTGRYIARRLLGRGVRVRTLTGHHDRPDLFGGRVGVAPLSFDDPAMLSKGLEGADVLYNTYWVRFPRGRVTFEKAVENSEALIRAAQEAGVRRVVHLSITGASVESPLPYFRAKGVVEEALAGSGLSYAIVRPTVVFGTEDILINNIAWFLRRSPVFTVFGAGDYPVQPVCVEDVAEIAVDAAAKDVDLVVDAAGPETYTFNELLRLIASTVGARARLVHLRPSPAHWLSRMAGLLLRDVVVTRDEIEGLCRGLLVSGDPPAGRTRLSRWLAENAASVGARYASELRRHYR